MHIFLVFEYCSSWPENSTTVSIDSVVLWVARCPKGQSLLVTYCNIILPRISTIAINPIRSYTLLIFARCPLHVKGFTSSGGMTVTLSLLRSHDRPKFRWNGRNSSVKYKLCSSLVGSSFVNCFITSRQSDAVLNHPWFASPTGFSSPGRLLPPQNPLARSHQQQRNGY